VVEEWRRQVLSTLAGRTKRSQRYLISVPLHFRIRGERVWHSGVCRNMSASGVLFESDAPVGPGADFEMHLALGTISGGRMETSIRFHGKIIRSPREGVWAASIFSRRLGRVQPARERDRSPMAQKFNPRAGERTVALQQQPGARGTRTSGLNAGPDSGYIARAGKRRPSAPRQIAQPTKSIQGRYA
jgi:hypothetical protein